MKFTFCKKQYVYLALAVVSACLALVTQVFAQEPNENARSAAEVQEMPPLPPQADTTRNSGAPQNQNGRGLSAEKHERVTNLARNLEARLGAAIERLGNVATRLESRMNKLDSEGIDTSIARNTLAQARLEINNARTAAQEMLNAFTTSTETETSRTIFVHGRTYFMDSISNIRNAHVHLRETVVLLKEAIRTKGADGVNEAIENSNIKQQETSN